MRRSPAATAVSQAWPDKTPAHDTAMNAHRFLRFNLLLAAVGVLCTTAVRGSSAAEDSTTRYFDQLRRRGLFRLAEGACLRKLARDDISGETRSQYTLEYSRTLAEQAKYRIGNEQQALWGRAKKVIDDYLQATPEAPRRKWLEMQRAVVFVLQGEFRRWDAELSPYNKPKRTEAFSALDRALAELQKLERSLTGGSNGAEERQLLKRHVRYQSAVVLVNLAELHPPGSSKRREAARGAAALLTPLSKLKSETPIVWNSRLLLAAVSRLQGDLKQATNRLEVIEKQKPPPRVKQHIVVELIKVLLAKGLVVQADRILAARETNRGGLPGPLAFLKVKTSIALWEAARKTGDTKRAAKLLQQAGDDVAVAEETVGGYWGYRCRVLFDFLKEARVYGPELAAAMRRAQSAFHGGKLPAAAKEYAEAARLAKTAGQRKLAAKLLFTQGSIRLQNREFESAAKVFSRIVDEFPKDDRAAQADLMAAYCLGRLYDAKRTKSLRLEYAQALEAHRKRFAKSDTVHDAAWMLASLHTYRRQWTEAIKLYLTIPAEHRRGPAAQLEAARVYEQIIDRLGMLKRPQDRQAWEAHAIARLTAMIKTFPDPPAALQPGQAEIALRTARLHLNRSPPGYQPADKLLDRVLRSGESALGEGATLQKPQRDFWTGTLRMGRQLRIVALAGTGKFDEARTLMKDLANAGPTEVLAVLDGLMQLGASADETVRERLGALQLQAALQLDRKRDKLKPAERKWLDRCLAQAHAATGRTDKAVSLYQEQLKKSPRNRTLRRTVAELLLRKGDRNSVLEARRHWRKLESSAKPGSLDWLAARYQVALCTYRLAEYAECTKLLKVTELLYPKLGNEQLRRKFRSLKQSVAKETNG